MFQPKARRSLNRARVPWPDALRCFELRTSGHASFWQSRWSPQTPNTNRWFCYIYRPIWTWSGQGGPRSSIPTSLNLLQPRCSSAMSTAFPNGTWVSWPGQWPPPCTDKARNQMLAKLKLPSEMEVAPCYKLLTLFTLFMLWLGLMGQMGHTPGHWYLPQIDPHTQIR